MSSYFDDASLVMIPSGYKTSKVYSVKPTDGTGDLTFTRSNSTASRVASNGLIEKVRTNLILQSNTFNTTWSTSSATITGGQAGYDGTNNAWELNSSASGGGILQSNTQAGLQTFSVYAKGSVSTGIRLYAFGSVNFFAYFNLNTGAVGSASAGVTARIQSVGSGWYRCSISFDQTNTTLRFYTTDNNNSNAAGIVYIQDAQLETGDIATQPILTTSAAVSVGPVANIPRLDYLNSSCPRLLLEGQRVNLVSYSEAFNDASWAKTRCTVTANAGTSPDGYANADKFVEDSTNNSKFFAKSVTTVDSSSYTLSLFAKAAERNQVALVSRDKAGAFKTTVFGLTSGTIVSDQHTGTKIEDYGNGWYRCSVVFNSGTGATATTMYVQTALNGNLSYQGDGTSGILIYGAGWELGSYVTSYIPTLGAAVTRGADAASKTGISSLIGSSAGTMFIDLNDYDSQSSAQNGDLIAIQNATPSLGAILIVINRTNKNLQMYQLPQNTTVTLKTGNNTNQRLKIAIVYNGSSFKGFVNGVQTYTGTLTAVAGLSEVIINTITGKESQAKINQVLIFKTPLSDADAIALTA